MPMLNYLVSSLDQDFFEWKLHIYEHKISSKKDNYNFFKCLEPLEVTASGNSATLLSLKSVTFLTSKILLSQRKSNLVS